MYNGCLAAFLASLAVASTAGCSKPKFEKVAPDQVDATQKAAAEQFAVAILNAWNQEQYPNVDDQLTTDMKASFSPAQQKDFRQKNHELLGAFKAMTFVEVQRSVPAEWTVYRFKGSFEKNEHWEVRVVVDQQGKVGGFWAKPWKDGLG